MISKKIIKNRKAIYGSNFSCIKNKWERILQKKVTEQEVAECMVELKECRIEAIKKRIEKTTNEKELKKLQKALNDSVTDRDNYEWIANNYEEL